MGSSLLLQGDSLTSSGVVSLILLGVGVVLVLLGGIWLMAKRDVFAPSNENTETAAERAEEQEILQRGSFEIPLRSRVQSISGAGKAVLLSASLFGVLVVYLIYKMMQTGSPAEEYLTLETAIGAVGLVGIIGGWRLHKWADSRIGTMYNIYESPGGVPECEEVDYLKDEMRNVGDETVIQQLHPTKLLGVFNRRKLIGHHRELRSSAKPLTDVVTHSIPSGGHCFELADGLIVNLTQGEPVFHKSPEAPSDVSYRSPNSLSYERAVGIEHSKERMKIERDAWQTTAAAKDSELERLTDMILNREWEDKADLMKLLKEYEQMQRRRTIQEVDARNGGITRSAQADGQSVLKNGEQEEGE